MVFGLRYLLSEKFRRQTEHEADFIAIDHGFHKEILATKKFILEHELLQPKYKDKILKYYLSSEAVKERVLENVHIHPTDNPETTP